MWRESEIEKLKNICTDEAKLEDFLTSEEIETIRGEFLDGRWTNATRYNNLINQVFVPKREWTKVNIYKLTLITIFVAPNNKNMPPLYSRSQH